MEIKKECRFYEKELPDTGDKVIVVVSDFCENAITVQLLEYNRIEGMVTMADYTRWKNGKYSQGIIKAKKMKKQEVCIVTNVDKKKGFIDLSKKIVKNEEKKEAEENFEKGKRVQSLLYPLCDAFKMNMEELYKIIVWPLQANDRHANDVFEQSIFNLAAVLDPLELPVAIRERLEVEIRKKYTPQPTKIKAIFDLRSYAPDGIEQIKAILTEGEKASTSDIQVKASLIAPPFYILQTTTMDKTKGIEVIQTAIDAVKNSVSSSNGFFELKQFLKGTDEKSLAYELTLQNQGAANEGHNEEEDNDEGMGDDPVGLS